MKVDRELLKNWLAEGNMCGATHMIVGSDRIDQVHSSGYVMPGEDVRAYIAQRELVDTIEEVYCLRMNWDSQLNEERAFHLDFQLG